MRIVLVGDIHMYRLLMPPWELAGKALVGQANVWFNRRQHFDRQLLRPVLERIASLQPDLLLLSGDLTSIGAGSEFRRLAAILGPLTRQVPTVAVPGNHDRYTRLATWGRRMEKTFPEAVPALFPHMRALNENWKLLALDTAVPSLLTSRGRIGAAQLDQAREMVKSLTAQSGLIVLAHYALGTPPPMPSMKRNHQLSDAAVMLDLLARCPGPVFYLHGHVHIPWCWSRQADGLPHVVDINAGAPCQTGPDFPHGQGFWQIDLPDGPARLEQVSLTRHIPTGTAVDGQELVWKREQVLASRVEIDAATGR